MIEFITGDTTIKTTALTDYAVVQYLKDKNELGLKAYRILEEVLRQVRLHVKEERSCGQFKRIDPNVQVSSANDEKGTVVYTLTMPYRYIKQLINEKMYSVDGGIEGKSLKMNDKKIKDIFEVFDKLVYSTNTEIFDFDGRGITKGFLINRFTVRVDDSEERVSKDTDLSKVTEVRFVMDAQVFQSIDSNDASKNNFAIISYIEKLALSDVQTCLFYDWVMRERPYFMQAGGNEVSLHRVVNKVLYYTANQNQLRSKDMSNKRSGAYMFNKIKKIIDELNSKVSFCRFERGNEDFELGPSIYRLVLVNEDEFDWSKTYKKNNDVPNLIFKLEEIKVEVKDCPEQKQLPEPQQYSSPRYDWDSLSADRKIEMALKHGMKKYGLKLDADIKTAIEEVKVGCDRYCYGDYSNIDFYIPRMFRHYCQEFSSRYRGGSDTFKVENFTNTMFTSLQELLPYGEYHRRAGTVSHLFSAEAIKMMRQAGCNYADEEEIWDKYLDSQGFTGEEF